MRRASDAISAAIRSGYHAIDTADAYLLGRSETCVGHALCATAASHPPPTLITKLGWKFYDFQLEPEQVSEIVSRTALPLTGVSERVLPFDVGQDFSAAYLSFAYLRSVERLGLRPDVLLLHNPPLDPDGTFESIDARSALSKPGVKIGVSVREPAEFLGAVNTSWVEAIEFPWTARPRPQEQMLLVAAQRYGKITIGRSVLRHTFNPQHVFPESVPASRSQIIDALTYTSGLDFVLHGVSSREQVLTSKEVADTANKGCTRQLPTVSQPAFVRQKTLPWSADMDRYLRTATTNTSANR